MKEAVECKVPMPMFEICNVSGRHISLGEVSSVIAKAPKIGHSWLATEDY